MIGLIFGDTDFPKEILRKIKQKNFKYLIIDLSKNKSFKHDKNSKVFPLVNLEKLLMLLKKINVKRCFLQAKLKNLCFLN